MFANTNAVAPQSWPGQASCADAQLGALKSTFGEVEQMEILQLEKGITECLFSSGTAGTATTLSLRQQFDFKEDRTGGFCHVSLPASRLLVSALTKGKLRGTECSALHRRAQRNVLQIQQMTL